MFKNNKNLIVIAVIAIVNALGYGIIIPVLYSYTQKFGLSDFQNGLLFSIYSVFQFLSTPLIGRLSDKYGRKPLLLLSIAGTAVSFFMMAAAPSALFLFIARALDGITAGNLPVASAVISDTTKPEDRAKGFGIIGASFGFGFIFGPAIAALTLGFGITVPFLVAGIVSIGAFILTAIMLPETNKHLGEVAKGKVFDFIKLIKSVTDEDIGLTLIVSLLYSAAFFMYIYAIQPFSVKMLHLTTTQISINFTVFGIAGLIAQAVIIPKIVAFIGDRKALISSLLATTVTFFSLFLVRNEIVFLFVAVFHSLANSFVAPLVQTLLSKETDAKSQGSILGLNASYVSIGMILGPLLGGLLATVSIPFPLVGGSVACLICAIISVEIMHRHHRKQSAF
jgi:predicted MFS family arabinose efflux permease